MSKKATYISIGLMVAIAVFFWWARRYSQAQEATPTDVQDLGVDPAFANPYYYTNAGIPDLPQILNGASTPFQSIINVDVNVDAYSGLSNKYIPMFGMVGVTAYGG